MIRLSFDEALWCSKRSDLAFIEKCNGRSVLLGLHEIMGGHKYGRAIRYCLIEQIPHRQTCMRVKTRGWLVKNYQARASE